MAKTGAAAAFPAVLGLQAHLDPLLPYAALDKCAALLTQHSAVSFALCGRITKKRLFNLCP